jgi:hypothetical protein
MVVDAALQATELESSELVYHRQLMDGLKRAQETSRQAEIDVVKAQGAVEAWSRFVMGRYGLNEGDSIDEQGRFIRKDTSS